MVRPTSWLPLAVLLLLVALTMWLNSLVQPREPRVDGARRHDPDLMVENFSARKLGEDGRVRYTLVARKMVHYPDDDSAHLETVRLDSFEPGRPQLTVTAERGRIEQSGERVWIEGNVLVVRAGDARSEPARVTTEKLLVLPDEGIARTSSEVTLETPSGRARATGLELDNQKRTLRLEKVRATFKPGTRSPAP